MAQPKHRCPSTAPNTKHPRGAADAARQFKTTPCLTSKAPRSLLCSFGATVSFASMPYPWLRALGPVVLLTAGAAMDYQAEPAPLPHRIDRMRFQPFSADTGWWPSNSRIQVRFLLDVGSGPTVD